MVRFTAARSFPVLAARFPVNSLMRWFNSLFRRVGDLKKKQRNSAGYT
jgi:hypothetical protein